MDSVRITDARRRFLERFDHYTNGGTQPQSLDEIWRKLQIQPRVINYCRRQGLIKLAGENNSYVVTSEARRLAKLTERMMNRTHSTLETVVRRRTRKRSSAMIKS